MPNATLSPPSAAPVRFRPPYQRFDPARVVGKMTLAEWDDYLARSKHKSDYINGEVVIAAGASPQHNLIQMNVAVSIGNALEAADSECEALGSDQKIYVAERLYYFPDLIVVCGSWKVDMRDAIQNPAAIIEVLSESTATDDRTDKFRDYQRIATLRHYLLIDQYRIAVTHYEKLENGPWAIAGDYRALTDTVTLSFGETNVAVPLSRIYRRVEIPDALAETAPD